VRVYAAQPEAEEEVEHPPVVVEEIPGTATENEAESMVSQEIKSEKEDALPE